jgi:hypothetical protein
MSSSVDVPPAACAIAVVLLVGVIRIVPWRPFATCCPGRGIARREGGPASLIYPLVIREWRRERRRERTIVICQLERLMVRRIHRLQSWPARSERRGETTQHHPEHTFQQLGVDGTLSLSCLALGRLDGRRWRGYGIGGRFLASDRCRGRISGGVLRASRSVGVQISKPLFRHSSLLNHRRYAFHTTDIGPGTNVGY